MKATQPGELVQIDHMTVYVEAQSIKHFKAVCPTTKMMIAKVYRSVSSNNARDFLKKVMRELPFPLRSVQVDGGAELR